MRLQNKFALSVFLLGLLAVSAMGAFHYLQSRQEDISGQLKRLEKHARLYSEHLDTLLASRASTLMALTESPALKKALRASNDRLGSLTPAERRVEIQRLDRRWRAAESVEAPVIRTRLTGPAAGILKAHAQNDPQTYGELFVTDRYGVTVGATRRLTDLYQGDEYHWRAPYNDGRGRIFFDDRGLDTSAGEPVLGVAVPVREDGQVLGILKGNLLLTGTLHNFLDSYRKAGPGTIRIARSGGQVILGPESPALQGRVDMELRAAMVAGEAGSFASQAGEGTLTAFAPVGLTLSGGDYGFGGRLISEEQRRGNQGEIWYLVVQQPMPRALAPLEHRIRDALVIGSLAVVLLTLLALALGRRLTRPLGGLTQAFGSVAEGNLDVRVPSRSRDEVGQLARAFNRMVKELRQTRASRDRLLEIIEATPDFVGLADTEGNVLYRNPGGWALLGLDPDTSPTRYQAGEVLSGWARERFRSEAWPTALKEGFWQGEMAFRHADGHEVPVVQILLAHRGTDGQVEYVSTIAHDLSAFKQQREELERHRRLTVMGELGSVLAHQLNQPLASAEGFAQGTIQRLDRGREDPEGVRYGLEQTMAQIRKVGEIVHGLRNFLRAGQPRLQDTDLNELIGGLVPTLGSGEEGKRCRIRLQLAEDLPPLAVDPVLLRECLLNLVRNAVEATLEAGDPEGPVEITTRPIEGGERVEIAIRDRGPGLPEPLADCLDQPLFTTKPEGTGLGLSICRTVMEAHKGQLWATSNAPEPGTTFRISLPIPESGEEAQALAVEPRALKDGELPG